MLQLKTSNELVYIDFSKKDFNEFKSTHYKKNISKISIVVNNVLANNFTFINRLGKFLSKHGRYNNTSVVLYTGFWHGNKIANKIIRKGISSDLKYRLEGGRIWISFSNNKELFIIKHPFSLLLNINQYCDYGNKDTIVHKYIDEDHYPNKFVYPKSFSENIQEKVYNDRLKALLETGGCTVEGISKTAIRRDSDTKRVH